MRSVRLSRSRLSTVAVISLVVMPAFAGCDRLPWSRSSGSLSRSGSLASCSYEAIWHIEPEPDEVVHIVLIPDGAYFPLIGSLGKGIKPLPKGISSFRDGLYMDGLPEPRGPGRRVFVVNREGKFRPVPLSVEEEKSLVPANWDRVETSEVWAKKIQPVLEEEKRR